MGGDTNPLMAASNPRTKTNLDVIENVPGMLKEILTKSGFERDGL
jgi:hypothetical protein